MKRHRFELAGGDPALDFLNTVRAWKPVPSLDYVGDFGDAIRFGRAAGLLSAAEARHLGAVVDPRELRRLRGLRSLLERIFRRQVNGKAPAAPDLERLGAVLVGVTRATRLEGAAGRPIRRRVDGGAAGASLLRLRVAEAALRLLTDADLRRVKECPTCGWFFLDASKNGSRRWCSMASCGASAKARRYYRRQRGLTEP